MEVSSLFFFSFFLFLLLFLGGMMLSEWMDGWMNNSSWASLGGFLFLRKTGRKKRLTSKTTL